MGKAHQIYAESHDKWLPENACLWRYVPLKTLFLYLTGNVFLPSIAKLQQGDPFEGRFLFETEWFNQVMLERYAAQLGALNEWIYRTLCTAQEKKAIDLNKNDPNYAAGIFEDHYFEFLRKSRYGWCWFLSATESAAMWNTYGKHGVAVATTVGKLREVLEKTAFDFVFGQMFYIALLSGRTTELNPERPEHRKFLLQPHFLKRREYESEKEVRFITCGPEREAGGLLLIGVPVKDWLQEIRLWPELTISEERSLKQIVESLLPGARCSKSDLMQREGEWFETTEMATDLSRVADQMWKDGTDSIPAALKELWP